MSRRKQRFNLSSGNESPGMRTRTNLRPHAAVIDVRTQSRPFAFAAYSA